jgi:Na+/H+ antiporter NhaD/arsenite permease-like protein
MEILEGQETSHKVFNCLGVIAFFGFHGSLHIEVSVIALGGAAVLLVITKANPEKVMQEVDWTTLIFLQDYLLLWALQNMLD